MGMNVLYKMKKVKYLTAPVIGLISPCLSTKIDMTKEIKAKSPYSDAPKKLRRQIMMDNFYFSLDRILHWPKLSKKSAN